MAGSSEQAGGQAASTAGPVSFRSEIGDTFQRAGAQLVGINGQQTDLQAAIGEGKLWMAEGVAEEAARRCEQAAREITKSLNGADQLTWPRKFGNNKDGIAAAERFAQAGQEYIAMMEKARKVIEEMGATYRAAGLAAAQADEAGRQSLQGKVSMTRGVWAAGMAAVGLLVGGCGSAASGASAPPTVGDASGVDMCTILTEDELSGLGIELDTREPVDRLGEVGCSWIGKPITLTLVRDENPIADWAGRLDDPAFVTFAENTVNGRAGVQFGVRRSGDQCAQVMDGGPVSVLVSVAAASSLGPSIDPCGEALRIAQLIETRLPKAGT